MRVEPPFVRLHVGAEAQVDHGDPALAHGAERPRLRLRQGKPTAGGVQLQLRLRQPQIVRHDLQKAASQPQPGGFGENMVPRHKDHMHARRQPLGQKRQNARQIAALQQVHIVENEIDRAVKGGQRVLQQLTQQKPRMRPLRIAQRAQLRGKRRPAPQRAAEAVPEIGLAVRGDELAQDAGVGDLPRLVLLPPFDGGRFAVAHGRDDRGDGVRADLAERRLQARRDIGAVEMRILAHTGASCCGRCRFLF